MRSASQRFVLLALLLVGLWIGVYWAWPADSAVQQAAIVFDEPSPPESPEADPALEPTEDESTPPARSLASPSRDPLLVDGPPAPTPEQQAMALGEETAAEDTEEPDPAYPDGVIPPEMREYVVRPDDDIMSLAKREYGAVRHWQAIAKANPDKDPNRMIVGDVWRLPVDPENIQGLPVDPETGEPVEEPQDVVAEPETIEYTVVSGDTLSAISRMFYGTTTKWRRIRDANSDKVNRDGTNIRPGMKLIIPPLESPAEDG